MDYKQEQELLIKKLLKKLDDLEEQIIKELKELEQKKMNNKKILEGDYVKIITKEKIYYGFAVMLKNNLYVKGQLLSDLEKKYKIVKTKCKFQKHKFFLFKKIIRNL